MRTPRSLSRVVNGRACPATRRMSVMTMRRRVTLRRDGPGPRHGDVAPGQGGGTPAAVEIEALQTGLDLGMTLVDTAAATRRLAQRASIQPWTRQRHRTPDAGARARSCARAGSRRPPRGPQRHSLQPGAQGAGDSGQRAGRPGSSSRARRSRGCDHRIAIVVRPQGSLRKRGERIVAPDPRVVDAGVGASRDCPERVRSGDASDVSVAAVELGRNRRRTRWDWKSATIVHPCSCSASRSLSATACRMSR